MSSIGGDGWTSKALSFQLSCSILDNLDPTTREQLGLDDLVETPGNLVEHFPRLYIPFLQAHWPLWSVTAPRALISVRQSISEIVHDVLVTQFSRIAHWAGYKIQVAMED